MGMFRWVYYIILHVPESSHRPWIIGCLTNSSPENEKLRGIGYHSVGKTKAAKLCFVNSRSLVNQSIRSLPRRTRANCRDCRKVGVRVGGRSITFPFNYFLEWREQSVHYRNAVLDICSRALSSPSSPKPAGKDWAGPVVDMALLGRRGARFLTVIFAP